MPTVKLDQPIKYLSIDERRVTYLVKDPILAGRRHCFAAPFQKPESYEHMKYFKV